VSFTCRARALWTGAALLVLGCGPTPREPDSESGGGSAGGTGGSAGAPAGMLEVQPLMYTPIDMPVDLVEEGDAIELWRAPQGGHVLLVGARVKNLESDTVELRARLLDGETGAIVAEEARTVLMVEADDAPGWMQNDRRTRSQVCHVPVCPDYDDADVRDREHRLQVEVTALYSNFATGVGERRVLPTCMQEHPDELATCECECEADYVLGKCEPGAQ
jgi:hypothetical protein